MDKIQEFMEAKVLPFAMKLSGQNHLAAIRDGMTVLIPLSIIGGLALVLAVPPIPADTTSELLLAIREFLGGYSSIFWTIFRMTIGVVSIYVTAGVSYQLAKKYKLSTITNVVSAVFIFLLVAAEPDGTTLQMSGLGASSMFSSLVISILVVEVNRFCVERNITIKLPSSVPPNVAAPFTILIPTVFNIVIFMTVDTLLRNATGTGITQIIYTLLQPLLGTGDGLFFIIFICLVSIFFWFFGIHGGNMIGIVTAPITTLNLAMNAEAYASGLPLPRIWVGSYHAIFGDQLAQMALLIAIFIAARSARLRSIAKVSITPAIFQITEPIIFGIPTVLNILTLIPIVICTLINLTVSYLLMSSGIVGKYFVALPFTVPGPLNAFLSTLDIRAAILWFVLLAVNVAIMMPFMKTYDKQIIKEELVEAEQATA